MKPMPLDLQILRDLVAVWWRQFDFRKAGTDSFKTALAAVLSLWLAHLVGLQHGYWAAISAIVVMGSDAGVPFTSSRDRIIGTGVGALLAWGTSPLWRSLSSS